MTIRDRIIDFRRVRADTLHVHAKNWRLHPDQQRTALEQALASIGYADALIVREDDNGELHLIDGHLRAEVTPDMDVPVLVTNLTESEADALLATLDPLSAMAETDLSALEELLRGIESDDVLAGLLETIAERNGIALGFTDTPAGAGGGDALGDMAPVQFVFQMPKSKWTPDFEEECRMIAEREGIQFAIHGGNT